MLSIVNSLAMCLIVVIVDTEGPEASLVTKSPLL